MSSFSTPAIILRRIGFGDYDLILSLMTLNRGKISAIAKSARKSTKRFAGILEPFSVLEVVCTTGKGKGGLPVLQEAVMKQPFSVIRSDVKVAAYASYWAELIDGWLEDAERQSDVYHLFHHSLAGLEAGIIPVEALSILFQIRFAALSGYGPNLTHCSSCKKALEDIKGSRLAIDVKRGGLVCGGCGFRSSGGLSLSKGTIKQLLWIESGDLSKAKKIRLDRLAIKESLNFLEAFVPYHLGKAPRSLAFLRQIRT